MTDRRVHPRVPCLATVREYGWAEPLESRAVNISEGGLYLQRFTDEPFCPGENLYLEVELPDGLIEAVGRVVKAAHEVFHEAAAITFTAITGHDARRIRRYVDDCKRGLPPVVIARVLPSA